MEVDKSSAKYYKYKFRCTPAVKENAEDENDDVFVLFIGKVITKQESRKEKEEENDAAENHYLYLTKWNWGGLRTGI